MNNTDVNNTDYDVVIVGAGIAGATLAGALGGSDYRVGLLDRAVRPTWPDDRNTPGDGPEDCNNATDYDARVSAINVGSSRVLQSVGAWSAITSRRHQPFHRMRVWDETGTGVTQFDATQLGETRFGVIAENRLTTCALLEAVSGFDNISLRFESSLTSLEHQDRHCKITLDDGQSITTRLLVGADGGRSAVRELAAIDMPFKNYQQRTLVGTVATEHHHQNTAWQRFLPTGPCAYLPLAPHLCSLAWHADNDLADELLALDDADFNARLASASEHCLGEPTIVSVRSAFPLFKGHANSYLSERLALIGDAAHVVHPLAGLGANLGIMDAACLAECLLDFGHDDPGRARALRQYERWRRPENAAVIAATDAFYEVFGHPRRLAG